MRARRSEAIAHDRARLAAAVARAARGDRRGRVLPHHQPGVGRPARAGIGGACCGRLASNGAAAGTPGRAAPRTLQVCRQRRRQLHLRQARRKQQVVADRHAHGARAHRRSIGATGRRGDGGKRRRREPAHGAAERVGAGCAQRVRPDGLRGAERASRVGAAASARRGARPAAFTLRWKPRRDSGAARSAASTDGCQNATRRAEPGAQQPGEHEQRLPAKGGRRPHARARPVRHRCRVGIVEGLLPPRLLAEQRADVGEQRAAAGRIAIRFDDRYAPDGAEPLGPAVLARGEGEPHRALARRRRRSWRQAARRARGPICHGATSPSAPAASSTPPSTNTMYPTNSTSALIGPRRSRSRIHNSPRPPFQPSRSQPCSAMPWIQRLFCRTALRRAARESRRASPPAGRPRRARGGTASGRRTP